MGDPFVGCGLRGTLGKGPGKKDRQMGDLDPFSESIPKFDLTGGAPCGHGGGPAFFHGAALAFENLPGEFRVLDEIGARPSGATVRIGHGPEAISEKARDQAVGSLGDSGRPEMAGFMIGQRARERMVSEIPFDLPTDGVHLV